LFLLPFWPRTLTKRDTRVDGKATIIGRNYVQGIPTNVMAVVLLNIVKFFGFIISTGTLCYESPYVKSFCLETKIEKKLNIRIYIFARIPK